MRRVGLALLVLVLLAPLAVLAWLNSAQGQLWAEQKINGTGGIQITGLAGHFPSDLKAQSLTLTDSQGVWLTATNAELRASPWSLLHHQLHITSLTANTVALIRPPQGSGGSSSASLPALDLDALTIGQFTYGPQVTLHIAASAHLHGTDMRGTLLATSPDGRATYRLDDTPNGFLLHAAEPANGLMARLLAPTLHAAWGLDATLDNTALTATGHAGTATLTATGTLTPTTADLIFTAPDLAPFTQTRVRGTATLHVIAQRQGDGASFTASLTAPALRQPHGAPTEVALQVRGTANTNAVNLTTTAHIASLTAVWPGLRGSVDETGTITGPFTDLAATARLTGTARTPQIPSGPFTLSLTAQHLPRAPALTLIGEGALANAPLALNAQFAQNHLVLTSLHWRSLAATADLTVTPHALPSGTAHVALGQARDLAVLLPFAVPSGSLHADFSASPNATLSLSATAQALSFTPSFSPLNGTFTAHGTASTLAVQTRFTFDSYHVSATGTLNTQPGLNLHNALVSVNNGQISLDGTLTPRLALHASATVPLTLALPGAKGTLSAQALLGGTLQTPTGSLALQGSGLRLPQATTTPLPDADFSAHAQLAGSTAALTLTASAGNALSLTANGTAPLRPDGPLNLHLTSTADLRLLDALLAPYGVFIQGHLGAELLLTGTPQAPQASGPVTLTGGAVQDLNIGLAITSIICQGHMAGTKLLADHLAGHAGKGDITGHGTLDFASLALPLDVTLTGTGITPLTSDLFTETLSGTLHLSGNATGALALSGALHVKQADITLPHGLPPDIANLPIHAKGEPPALPSVPTPPLALDVTLTAKDHLFLRGDSLFAEFGGKVHLGGTAQTPAPQGGFDLLRGNIALAGRDLDFTTGQVSFTGNGLTPALDLDATSITSSGTATLTVGGTATQPKITLTSVPPLPADETLALLLFGQTTASLSPFQAASLAASLAQLSGVGAGLNPLDKVRNVLGLDQLSLGSSTAPTTASAANNTAPTVQAGRYVAPGVYLGAAQSTGGQGTTATVEITLSHGLKLTTTTGTASTGGGTASSVGLSYQFNY